MAETSQTLQKRAVINVPPTNRKLEIKRMQRNGLYESEWLDITDYVISYGTFTVGFPDSVFVGEYNEEDFSVVLNNNKRKFNRETDSSSLFFGYRSRLKTKFRVSLYAVDKDDNDVLLRAFYGIHLGNPTISDNAEITFSVSSLLKVLQLYQASGIDLSAGTTEDLVNRLVAKTQDGVSIFDQYFEGYSINPDSDTCMTISKPYIEDKATILDKFKDYSFYQDFFYYVDNNGYLVWDNREPTASVQWELNGAGQVDSSYGQNIIAINEEKDDMDNTYTRVVIEYASNGIVGEKTFSGLRNAGDTASLSDANSSTIFSWLNSNGYLDSSYRVGQDYITDRATVVAYLDASWSGYKSSILQTLDKLIRSDKASIVKENAWSIGDGSVADIYGEKTFSINKPELNETEATTVADLVYTNYSSSKTVWSIETFGTFSLYPKDKVEINYLGEISVSNPFVLGVSLLGGGDVLAGRLGAIRIDAENAKVSAISINLDDFGILLKVKET